MSNSNSARESTALEAEAFDVRFEAIISKMDNHRMQMNGMNKDLLRLLQKAANDFGGARLDTAVTENNALKEQVNGLKRRLEDLEDENKKLGTDYARLDKDHTLLEKDHANLQDDLRDCDKKNRELEERLSESEQTLSQFMALSSRVANANVTHKRSAEDDWPTHSKKSRQSYDGQAKDFREDDRFRDRSRYDAPMDAASRREFRDYSPSERPLHEPLDHLRNRDELYSSSGNAQGKVSDYLARLPTPSNTRDDNSSLDRTKTPQSADDINIIGKASIHNSDKEFMRSSHLVPIPTGPLNNTPARDSRRPEGFIEVHEGAKVWRRNDGSTSIAQNGNDSAAVTGGGSSTMNQSNQNGSGDNRNGNQRNDSTGGSHDTRPHQNGGPSNLTQSLAPQQHQHVNQRRRIVCHACWEVRGRCDNRHTCGNCAADGLECVRSICSDYQKHGICPRGPACFKVHDEQGYKAVTFSPFNAQENKRRYNRDFLNGNASGITV